MEIRTKHITSINYNTRGKSFPDYAEQSLLKVLAGSTKIKLMSAPYTLQEPQADMLTLHVVKALMAHYSGDEKIPATENTFIDSLMNSKEPNLLKLGFSLKYLWTDLFPADNNVILNLKNGAVTDFIY
jgi:hypothetical protein